LQSAKEERHAPRYLTRTIHPPKTKASLAAAAIISRGCIKQDKESASTVEAPTIVSLKSSGIPSRLTANPDQISGSPSRNCGQQSRGLLQTTELFEKYSPIPQASIEVGHRKKPPPPRRNPSNGSTIGLAPSGLVGNLRAVSLSGLRSRAGQTRTPSDPAEGKRSNEHSAFGVFRNGFSRCAGAVSTELRRP